jgi:aldose 1-epimerase
VGNRIEGNKITLDGKEYTLLNNEGENTFHGGVDGLSTKVFDAEIIEANDYIKVIYHYLSKDLESGFPGNLDVYVTYTVNKDKPELLIEFKATTDKVTYCSLTNHAYYTVGEPSLYTTKLYINSSNYLHVRQNDSIPIEKRALPEYMNFKIIKEITKDINHPILLDSKAHGYDHHYFFDNENEFNTLKASLIGRKYKMDIFTDFKGMQIYSCNYLKTTYPHYELDNIVHKSLAMEPQDDFLNINILKPGEIYNKFIKLCFTKNI